jgi:hypothetical protein
MLSDDVSRCALIERHSKSASGSTLRLPAAAAAAPIGPDMPPTHHLAGPAALGAAREPPKPPIGHIPASAACTAAQQQIEQSQYRRKSGVGAAGEGGSGNGGGGGDARCAGGAHGAVGGGPGAVGGT